MKRQRPRTDDDKKRRSGRYLERTDAPRAALKLFRVPARVRRQLVIMCPPAAPEDCDGEAKWVEAQKAARAAPHQREARRREYRKELEAWRTEHCRDAPPSERYRIARPIVERARAASHAWRFSDLIIAEIMEARGTLTQEDAARDAQALRNELTKLGTMLGRTARTLDERPEGARLTAKRALPIIKAAAYLRTSDSPDALLLRALLRREGGGRALLVDALREVRAQHDAATASGKRPQIFTGAGTAGLSVDVADLLHDAGADALACGDALAEFIKRPSPVALADAHALVAALREALPRARGQVGGRIPAPQLRHGTAVELAVRVLRIARDYGMRDLPAWYDDSTKDGVRVSAPVALVARAGACVDPRADPRADPLANSEDERARAGRDLRGWVEITTEAIKRLGPE